MSSWLLGVRKVARTVRNLIFDLRYGGFIGGYRRNPVIGATGTGATDYALMPQIFGGRIHPDDVLVDIGCGYGRVINWWLDQGHRSPIYGLEMMEEVAANTRHRLRRFSNVTIITGNALVSIPTNANVVYLFNPFDCAETMQQLLDKLYVIGGHRSDFVIIYFAAVHVAVAKADSRWVVEERILSLPDVGFFEERHRHLAIIRPRSVTAQIRPEKS